ncbi:hypothetical protein DdX_16524 [Ditylenchus destructor]|uniref:Uncharacterized protein n=1 Tax=Ditylenchus destructor TaxID=166010 RepID=A0AAD4MQS5_9BILA|nr:hypothetical protein DdX_16524 [Ditylenchus destructor]
MSKDDQKAKVIWPKASFEIQPQSEYIQLNTEEDQAGTIGVEHVIKRIREVYGQPPLDLVDVKPIDWTRYGIHMPERPKPEEFPAFQNDKNKLPISEPDQGQSDNVEISTIATKEAKNKETQQTSNLDKKSSEVSRDRHSSQVESGAKKAVNQSKPSLKKGSKTPNKNKQTSPYQSSLME